MDGILDNHSRGAAASFIRQRVVSGSNLSFVSAYFTIYAYEALSTVLDEAGSLRFLFGEPSFVGMRAASPSNWTAPPRDFSTPFRTEQLFWPRKPLRPLGGAGSSFCFSLPMTRSRASPRASSTSPWAPQTIAVRPSTPSSFWRSSWTEPSGPAPSSRRSRARSTGSSPCLSSCFSATRSASPWRLSTGGLASATARAMSSSGASPSSRIRATRQDEVPSTFAPA
jgi:hypothetical protein